VLQHGQVVNGRWIRCYVQSVLREDAFPDFGIPVRIGFAVPKKIASSAVLRNRIRRLMRETVRKDKELLWRCLREHKQTATLVLMLRRHDPAALKKLSLNDMAAEWHSMVPKIISLC
jgi:ribonuclease P protein component